MKNRILMTMPATLCLVVTLVGAGISSTAQAGTLVRFGEAFGLPTPFSVDPTTGEPARNMVRGVPAALQPWWVKKGEARVNTKGTISASVEYLVFAGGNATGTIGPISQVVLTLFCGSEQYSTEPVALEAEGMMRVKGAHLMPTPPGTCDNPALLVRIANSALPWIAAFVPEDDD